MKKIWQYNMQRFAAFGVDGRQFSGGQWGAAVHDSHFY